MRLAFVSDTYPGLGRQAGGIGSYTRAMSGCLARRGHDVHVFAGGGVGSFEDQGATVHLVPPVGDAEAVGTAVERTASAGGPFDVLESPEFKALGAVAVGRRDVARRLAVRLHGAETLLGHRPELWAGRVDPERALAVAADTVTAPSRSAIVMTDSAWRTRLRDRASVVPNPAPEVVRRRSSRPRFDAAFVGRLEPRKGVDTAAAVFARMRRPLSVVVIGEDHPWPDDRTGLQMLRESGVQVTYLGVVPPDEVLAALSQARTALVPSRRETFGLTLLEAMSAGVAAVASDIPPFRELVGRSRGVTLVAADDVGAWATAVEALLDDPRLAAAQGRRAKYRSQSFRVDLMADQLLTAWGAS